MLFRLLVLAAGIAAGVSGAAAGETSGVQVTNAWARATPAKAENGAAYVTIVSPVADRLVAVSTPVAKQAELHTMSLEGGVMKMRQVEGIDLAPGQPVTLKPGGLHIMLLGLTQPLAEGQSIPLTLSFEKGGKAEIAATVEKLGSMEPHGIGTGPLPTHSH